MSNQILEFLVDNKNIPVTLIRTKNKNMYLKIRDNKIIVSAPINFSMNFIKEFVSANINKFTNHLKVLKGNLKFSIEDKFVYLLGKKYDLEIFSGIKKESFDITNNVIYLNLRNNTNEYVTKYIKKILKELVKEKIIKIQRFWEEEMNIPKHEVSVVYKTSTWGSNILAKRKISYSAQLAHYDEKVLQYLVIHELSHYKVPNHSKTFWELVSLYIPNYKDIQKILKLDLSLKEE